MTRETMINLLREALRGMPEHGDARACVTQVFEALLETEVQTLHIDHNERDRCRREAQGGACPVCGRTEAVDLERQVRSYAQSVAALRAQLRGVSEALT